jgi:hypothetical protein
MKRFFWPPSPAAVIACVALFVALGGGAYAATQITSQDVKNNSLLSIDLKDGEGVKGVDVKNNSLKGKDIDESSLGKVPVANQLDDLRVIAPFDLTNGQSADILTHGPFTFTATCQINAAGDDIARILISTTQDNSSFDAWNEADDLDAATPETNRNFGPNVTVATGTTEVEANNLGGVAIAPDGTTIYLVDAFSAVNAPFAPAGSCSFSAAFLVG